MVKINRMAAVVKRAELALKKEEEEARKKEEELMLGAIKAAMRAALRRRPPNPARHTPRATRPVHEESKRLSDSL